MDLPADPSDSVSGGDPPFHLPETDVYFHEAGQVSRRAALDVGLKCPHSCTFCYYSYLDGTDDQFRGMRAAKFRSLDDCREILAGIRKNGFISFDVTGGEPSLHPNIIELTRYAHRDLGLRGRLITLGQFLMRKLPGCTREILVEDLLDAGLTDILLSIHAVSEPLFKRITGGSWERVRAAMCYLDDRGFSYTSGTTVFDGNFQHLPELATELLKHNVYMHNFSIMNPKYQWAHNQKSRGVYGKYSDIFPYLKEAVDILESRHVAVNVRYAPLCTMQGYEKNLVGAVGVRYDPYEWMNKAGHLGGNPDFCAAPLKIHPSGVDNGWVYREATLVRGPESVIARRGDKVYPSACSPCKARSACDGVYPKYIERFGSGEFRAYRNFELRGPVPLARRTYAPAFRVKMSQWADMTAVMRQAFASIAQPAVGTGTLGVVKASAASVDLSSQTLCPDVVHVCPQDEQALASMTGDCDVWIRIGRNVVEVPADFADTFAREFARRPDADIIYADFEDIDEAGNVSRRSAKLWSRPILASMLPAPSVIAFRKRAVDRLRTNWLYMRAAGSGVGLLATAFMLRMRIYHLPVPMAIAAALRRPPLIPGKIA